MPSSSITRQGGHRLTVQGAGGILHGEIVSREAGRRPNLPNDDSSIPALPMYARRGTHKECKSHVARRKLSGCLSCLLTKKSTEIPTDVNHRHEAKVALGQKAGMRPVMSGQRTALPENNIPYRKPNVENLTDPLRQGSAVVCGEGSGGESSDGILKWQERRAQTESGKHAAVAAVLSNPRPARPHKPEVAYVATSSCSSVSLIKKPSSMLKSSDKSSPPMNISSPKTGDMLTHVVKKASPIAIPLESSSNSHAKASLRINLQNLETEGDDREHTDRKVVWREGLLQRLSRLHGLGKCKLSLEELVDLDDCLCLEQVERLQQQRQQQQEDDPLTGLGLYHPEALPSFPLAAKAIPKPSMWKMDTEGRRSLVTPERNSDMRTLMLKKTGTRRNQEDDYVECPTSHTNYISESPASARQRHIYER
ncbi:hypothetical protein KP509_05G104200 [Ceratopteris richardii]|uniref:Uncharacterized protein n=1 Tax=Ceratopteris richardii TaxID=49495 RepID=A0A8T2UVZ9_CERRI|nr:hypothetical protein KP509_05G104200 [Ceratopteris richardii]